MNAIGFVKPAKHSSPSDALTWGRVKLPPMPVENFASMGFQIRVSDTVLRE